MESGEVASCDEEGEEVGDGIAETEERVGSEVARTPASQGCCSC